MEYIREDHCMDVSDYGVDISNIHSLKWCIYTRDKDDLIKRES